jgi:putative tricarboxylic transport membrane protein
VATFELLGLGFQNAFALGAFLTIVIGLLVGVVAGALPGISFVNAMAMSLPFTYVMSPVNAMLFLGGIYVGGVFGGSISAIMINVPGTPASLPACWDGYPMTQKGEGAPGLEHCHHSPRQPAGLQRADAGLRGRAVRRLRAVVSRSPSSSPRPCSAS